MYNLSLQDYALLLILMAGTSIAGGQGVVVRVNQHITETAASTRQFAAQYLETACNGAGGVRIGGLRQEEEELQ